MKFFLTKCVFFTTMFLQQQNLNYKQRKINDVRKNVQKKWKQRWFSENKCLKKKIVVREANVSFFQLQNFRLRKMLDVLKSKMFEKRC